MPSLATILEEIIGTVLGVAVLLDIFLLVLYACAHIGLISGFLANSIWRALVWLSRPLGHRRASFLTLTGPIILLTILVSWALLLSVAAALIIHPGRGTGVRATNGNTPTDFITALYAGGISLSFIGVSDFAPQTAFFRLFYLFTSLTGLSLVSLTITYLMQLYGSLLSRNALALKVHLLSSETGDAAEVIAGIGPRGMFEECYQILAQWAGDTADVKESHAFYDILFYFRSHQPFYSVSRTALTSLDTVTLIKCALDDKEYGWLKESAAVEQLRRGSLMELQTLGRFFLPDADIDAPPDERTRQRWQRRYDAGLERLQHAGIKTSKSGVDQYISMRTQWDRYITLLAPQYAYDLDDIDTALARVK